MKIGIDARMYGPEVGGGGLGRYVKELVDALQMIDTKNRYLVFLGRENFDAFRPTNPNFEKRLAPVHWYTVAEQIEMPRLIDREHLDLIHYPHWNVPLFAKTPFVVTIHDLLLLEERRSARAASRLPLPLYLMKRAGYRLVLSHALRHSRRIIAVSNWTHNSIIRYFPSLEAKKIERIYEGAPKAKPRDVLDRAPSILYVGNAYPHKNLEILLRAFAILREQQPNVELVLVGKADAFYRALEKKAGSGVVFKGFVPDEELDRLYTEASLAIFPSRHEGFGLPPLEAMARGVPVAAARSSAFPEVLGDAALFFNPNDATEMAQAMEQLLTDNTLREQFIARGLERITCFSWSRMAEATLRLYEEAAQKN